MLIRILLVEDDALQADVTCRILESQGLFVETASSGPDAIRKVLAGWFDVVLMDHNIPDFDGVSVGRIIADLIRNHGRPRLIALSARPDAIRAREAGTGSVFDMIIGKPWDPAELFAAIRRCHRTLPPPARRMEAVQHSLPIRYNSGRTDLGREVKILVIDDDAVLRGVVVLALDAAGYRVDPAANGLDALKLLANSTYDVVVIDYLIPHIDGLATGRLIFDLLPRADRPRLVALTSAPDLLASQEADQLSVFDEVIDKQDGIKALLDAVKRCAEYKTLRTKLAPPDVVRLDSILAIAIDTL